jgi:hypothetical protein
MSLQIAWVDRIFERLTVRYGDRFLNRWKGIDMDAVRSDWSCVLAGFENWPEAISFAIDHLDDEKPPTATMFRTIAMGAPKPERIALPEPKADPDRIAAELAKLAPLRNATASAQGPGDPKGWAKRIIDRHQAGEKINMTTLRMARDALRLNDDYLEAA